MGGVADRALQLLPPRGLALERALVVHGAAAGWNGPGGCRGGLMGPKSTWPESERMLMSCRGGE
jgi:hypothetical protein